jgi:hypothetical protein
MKTKSKTPVDSPEFVSENANLSLVLTGESGALGVEEVATEAVVCIKNGLSAARKSWKDIMSGTLRLIWLREQHSAQGARNDLVPDGKKSGFNRVLAEANVPPATAYRWIDQAEAFIAEIGLSKKNLPSPGAEEWARIESFVLGKVDLLSFLKLPIRADALPKDDEVLMRLRTAAELGDKMADQLLDQVVAGEIPLDEATKTYCRVEPAKRSKPPMLKLDDKSLKIRGRLAKALDTLEEGFSEWPSYEPEARIQAARRIMAVLAKMPKDCAFREF